MRRVNDALIFYLFLVNQVVTTILDTGLEKYSRGRRGAPAKGVGRETGARVQIPPSPPRTAWNLGFKLFLFLLFFRVDTTNVDAYLLNRIGTYQLIIKSC